DSVTRGIALLAAYSLGLGLPLFFSALALNVFLTSFKRIARHMRWITVGSGLFLVLVGVLIFTNSLTVLSAWLQKFGIGWYVAQ
ncbi:MAG: cytochrome c biogenesis protein CcdA, partial [Nitrospirae bacterium]|nr:cytochrome c biogenesis protein CcdA [Nitrospirota bacterium]